MVVKRSGWIVKQGGSKRSWKRRYYGIDGGNILYFESEKDFGHYFGASSNLPAKLPQKDGKAKEALCLGSIPLVDTCIRVTFSKKLGRQAIDVLAGDRRHRFYFESAADEEGSPLLTRTVEADADFLRQCRLPQERTLALVPAYNKLRDSFCEGFALVSTGNESAALRYVIVFFNAILIVKEKKENMPEAAMDLRTLDISVQNEASGGRVIVRNGSTFQQFTFQASPSSDEPLVIADVVERIKTFNRLNRLAHSLNMANSGMKKKDRVYFARKIVAFHKKRQEAARVAEEKRIAEEAAARAVAEELKRQEEEKEAAAAAAAACSQVANLSISSESSPAEALSPVASAPAAPSTPATPASREAANARLLAGMAFLKYGSVGTPHMKLVRVNAADGVISWENMSGAKEEKSIAFPIAATRGLASPLLKKKAKATQSELCFCLASKDRALDLQASQNSERESFLADLALVLDIPIHSE